MVFEGIVTDVINRLLGDYFENLDASQLKIGIWGGDVSFKDLIIRRTALDALGLPFRIVAGKLGSLVLKIPWKSIYVSPVEIEIKDLIILSIPSHSVNYNEEIEEKLKKELKVQQLNQLEAMKLLQAEKNAGKEKQNDSFVEKLVVQIIKNLQINIESIHFRYEDDSTKPEYPFSFGFILTSLNVHSTNEKWEKKTGGSSENTVFKIAKLQKLSAYWDSDSMLLSNPTNERKLSKHAKEFDLKYSDLIELGDVENKRNLIIEKMKSLIYEESSNTVLGPIQSEVRLKLTPSPEKGDEKNPPFSLPKALANIIMEELLFEATNNQFQDLMALVGAITLMTRAQYYRKYRPNANDHKGHYREWWKYAYNCVLEEEVRRRRRDWNWLHMKEHRELCRNYADAYYQKLLHKNHPTPAVEEKAREHEMSLDIFNIKLVQKQIDLRFEREESHLQPLGKSWFGGWFGWGGGTAKPNPENLSGRLQQAFTQEEKSKLFAAIEYEENASEVIYPVNYVEFRLEFELKRLMINIVNDIDPLTKNDKDLQQKIKLSISDVATEITTCRSSPKKEYQNQVLLNVFSHLKSLNLILRKKKGQDILRANFNNLSTQFLRKEKKSKAIFELTKLELLNMIENALYKEIVSVVEDRVMKVTVDIYNEATEGAGYYEMEKHDMNVYVETGSTNVIYLSKYFNIIVEFMNAFKMKEALKQASFAAALAAKENVQTAYEHVSRIALELKLKAPKIFIPKNETSSQAFLIDLGFLNIKNSFKMLSIDDPKNVPIVEIMKIGLANVKVSRILFSEKTHSMVVECLIIEPLSFFVKMERNLSDDWYQDIPLISITGHIDSILVKLNKDDYNLALACLFENIIAPPPAIEKQPTFATLEPDLFKEDKFTSSIGIDIAAASKKVKQLATKSSSTFLEVKIDFETMSLFLYEDAAHKAFGPTNNEFSGRIERNENSAFANFSIHKIIIDFAMNGDETMKCQIIVPDINLVDCRPGERAIKRLIERKLVHKGDHHQRKDLISFTFESEGPTGTFVNLDTMSLTIIVCLDYLLQIADFFILPPIKTIDAPKTTLHPPSHKPSALIGSSKAMLTDVKPVQDSPITMFFNLAETELILVETMTRLDTHCLLLNCGITAKLIINDNQTNFMGNIGNIKIVSCVFESQHRESTSADVIAPTAISLIYNESPEKGTTIDINTGNIFIRLTAGTIDLLLNISATLNTKSDLNISTKIENYSKIWEINQITDFNFWFLKQDQIVEIAKDALEEMEKVDSRISFEEIKTKEKLVLETGSILITLETGSGNQTRPMILIESDINVQAVDWSRNMRLGGKLKLEGAYFNPNLGMWEYLIEPCESRNNGKIAHQPWEMIFDYSIMDKSELEDADLENSVENVVPSKSPPVKVLISSDEVLELTVTKVSLNVFNLLSEEFKIGNAKNVNIRREISTAAYKILNDCGADIKVVLYQSDFVLVKNGLFIEEVVLVPGASVNLALRESYDLTKYRASILRDQEGKKERMLRVEIPNLEFEANIPVSKAESRYYHLKRKANWGAPYALLCDIRVKDASKIVTISGIVQIKNELKIAVDVYYLEDNDNRIRLAGSVEKGQSFNVPISCIYTNNCEFYFAPRGFGVSTMPFIWASLLRDNVTVSHLTCRSKYDDLEDFNLKIFGELKQAFLESTNRKTLESQMFIIYIKPPIIISNLLPMKLGYFLENKSQINVADLGQNLHITSLEIGSGEYGFSLVLPEFSDKTFRSRVIISKKTELLSPLNFESEDDPRKSVYMGMHKEEMEGTTLLHIFCPYWIVNRTGKTLIYKGDHGNMITHIKEFEGPLLYECKDKSIFVQKKAQVRIETDSELSDWCDKFPMDTPGSGGTLVCKSPKRKYEIGVEILLSQWGFTKIIIFTPKYYIINQSSNTINIYEEDEKEDSFQILQPNQCIPFWPKSKTPHLIASIEGTLEETVAFSYGKMHNTLLQLSNKHGGIYVDSNITDSNTTITLNDYIPGQAPILLVNSTSDVVIEFNDKGNQNTNTKMLDPGTCMLMTWDVPTGERIMSWSPQGVKTTYSEKCLGDGFGTFSKDDKDYYWISFLDGFQRVLLYTSDIELAKYLQTSKETEQVVMDVQLQFQGIGVSLVDNFNCREIVYTRIHSSEIQWESSKSGKKNWYRPLPLEDSVNLETTYQNYINEKAISKNVKSHIILDNGYEVDFIEMKMNKPYSGKIRRVFQTGIWLHLKLFPHSTFFHAKVNRLQIDNQLKECIFRTVLSPTKPPKTVSSSEDLPKPFAEISVVQRKTAHSSLNQFKYFKMLIQEFHIRLDIAILNAVVELFGEPPDTKLAKRVELYLKDYEDATTKFEIFLTRRIVDQGQKSFYDYLHCSPLKIHVSFSMGAGASQISNNVVNLLLQSFGVTLTEIQDAVFKLACLELQNKFLTGNQLYSEVYDHYSTQLIKQFYVVVFGLDVIGNPYGLVLGVKEGVTTFFYEPIQGAIQGPGEFAEGLAIGFKALVGQTIGGTAGAFAKITGTVGKGLAALTMDEEFQRKRRENLYKRPNAVSEGLAKSGKGLVLGVFDGVTGVFRKPVQRGIKEGVPGFFKGLGQGAIGLVTRPAGGLVDFASGSLQAVQRATSIKDEVRRMRPPRHIACQGILNPYVLHEAEGTLLLKEIDKGKYSDSDQYIAHALVNPHSSFVLLITTKRVLYIKRNTTFGGWDIEWTYTWEELDGPATLIDMGLSFNLKGPAPFKGFIKTNSKQKQLVIHFYNADVCTWILTKIEATYNSYVDPSTNPILSITEK